MKILVTLMLIHVFSGTVLADEKWNEYKQKYFVIHYQNAPLDFVKTVEHAAEEYYHDITKNLGFQRFESWRWNNRAQIYIFDNKEHYVKASPQLGWSAGHANPTSKTIRTFPAAAGFFDTTLPHELAHIILREFIGHKARVPLWFEEGVAMYHEKAKRWGAHDHVRKAIEEDRFIPLRELSIMRPYQGMSKELIELFYMESASIVKFLIDQNGDYRFRRFCRELQDGNRFEWTMKSIYPRYRDLQDLNEAWLRFLR